MEFSAAGRRLRKNSSLSDEDLSLLCSARENPMGWPWRYDDPATSALDDGARSADSGGHEKEREAIGPSLRCAAFRRSCRARRRGGKCLPRHSKSPLRRARPDVPDRRGLRGCLSSARSQTVDHARLAVEADAGVLSAGGASRWRRDDADPSISCLAAEGRREGWERVDEARLATTTAGGDGGGA